MQSSSRPRLVAFAAGAALLAGCATVAPDLPQYIAQPASDGPAVGQPTGPPASGAPPVAVQMSPPVQAVLRISQGVWEELTDDERARLRSKQDIVLLREDQYGVIIDAQGQDQSSPGTVGGAVIGSSVANAAYVDHALRGGNYSATTQLALGLVGAMIGSSLDAKPTAQFQFRYTVRQGDGEIKYFDEFKSAPFRHSVGVCVLLPDLSLVTQHLCTQTAAAVRARYLR